MEARFAGPRIIAGRARRGAPCARLAPMIRRASLKACCLLAAMAFVPGLPAAERTRTEAELKALASQIEKVRQQVRKDAVERDRLSRDLASAEGSVARTRGELERLRDERRAREQMRAALAKEKREHEARLAVSGKRWPPRCARRTRPDHANRSDCC
jgi:septal ring factor EnvC (AmiA/AmiB activator)